MTITFFKKYPKSDEDQSGPKSYRVDHSDFGDVLRTVYAKGVITDFEKVADDPIEVKSRVKVRIGDGEESDFIPLFFTPKALYWDGPDEIKATDFNAEGKYFEKAWMSFRCGDEVVIMLQAATGSDELNPVAVLGFADGVPRIGEHIFKIVCPATTGYYHKHGSTLNYDLPSVNRGFIYCNITPDSEGSLAYGAENEEKAGPDDIDLKLDKEITPINSDFYRATFSYDSITELWDYYYYKFLVPVGPYLLILQLMYVGRKYVTQGATFVDESRHSDNQYMNAVMILNTIENYDYATELQKTMLQRIATPSWDTYDVSNYAEMITFISAYSNDYGFPDVEMERQYHPDWSQVTINVRPHTKEELIAADMWPKEEE